jgi:hypothetical protein
MNHTLLSSDLFYIITRQTLLKSSTYEAIYMASIQHLQDVNILSIFYLHVYVQERIVFI